MKYISVLCYLLCIFLIEFLVNQLSARTGLWVVRDKLTNPAQIDSIISYAKSNNISDLFVQMRGRGRVLFKSNYESMEFNIKGFDPLSYIIEKVKNKNIRIHAWINVYLVWSQENKPEEETHPFNKLHSYILSDVNNYQLDEIYTNYIKKRKVEGFYLSPAEPEVNSYLLQLFKELVMKYNVDGIHFDYFRYPSDKFIGNMKFLNYLSNRYHYQLMAGANDGSRYLLSRPITELLGQFRLWLKTYYPEIELSVAVKPNPEIAFERYFQNWEEWVKKDMVDFVCLMAYTNKMNKFRRDIYSLRNMFHNKEKLWVGLGVYNKSFTDVKRQLEILHQTGFKHHLFFSYKYMNKFRMK